jgi:hypothetical protein
MEEEVEEQEEQEVEEQEEQEEEVYLPVDAEELSLVPGKVKPVDVQNAELDRDDPVR